MSPRRALLVAAIAALAHPWLGHAQERAAVRHDYRGCSPWGERRLQDGLGCDCQPGFVSIDRSYQGGGLVVHACVAREVGSLERRPRCPDGERFESGRCRPSRPPPVAPNAPCADPAAVGEACLAAGDRERARGEAGYASAARDFRLACEADRAAPRGCHEFGVMLRDGLGLNVDAPRAEEYLELACFGGYVPSCLAAARLLTPSTAERAYVIARMLVIACVASDAEACAELGDAVEQGRGIAPDVPGAERLYAFACEHGRPATCVERDRLRARRDDAAGSAARAALDRACADVRAARACEAVAEYQIARGDLGDLDRLCRADNDAACVRLAERRLEAGEHRAAREPLDLACGRGHLRACFLLGQGFVADPDRDLGTLEEAEEAHRRACDGHPRDGRPGDRRVEAEAPGVGRVVDGCGYATLDREARRPLFPTGASRYAWVALLGGAHVPVTFDRPVTGSLRLMLGLAYAEAGVGWRFPTVGDPWAYGVDISLAWRIVSYPRLDRARWSVVNPALGATLMYHYRVNGDGPLGDLGVAATLSNTVFFGCPLVGENDTLSFFGRVEFQYPLLNEHWFPPTALIFLGAGVREVTGLVNARCGGAPRPAGATPPHVEAADEGR